MKHVIDPDKLASTFGVQWRHFYEPIEDLTDEGSYIFELGGNISLGMHERDYDETSLSNITISKDINDKQELSILFQGITTVKYLPKLKAVILESLQDGVLSQVRIHANGNFVLTTGIKATKINRWTEIE